MHSQPLDNPHRWTLLAGDVAIFLAFAGLGRRAHSMGSALDDVAYTALPFLLAWLAVAPATGAYAASATAGPQRALRRAAGTWLLAFPLGLLLRTLMKRGDLPHWSFALVAGSFTLLLLGGWRALYSGWRR